MTSASRHLVLDAIRQATGGPVPEHPGLEGLGVRFPDPLAQYMESLKAVGGMPLRVASAQELPARLGELEVVRTAHKVASTVPAFPGNLDLSAVDDAHALEGVDVAVLPGRFAVAENGAVWVDSTAIGRHRAIFVITQHLVLVVEAGTIVQDMHEAYARLGPPRSGWGERFGVFISGPSKTADIEQSLVIGAHGARSCTVALVG